MSTSYYVVGAVLITGMLLSIGTKKLTVAGAVVGGVLGFFIFAGAGVTGLALLALFFLVGTIVTSWKRTWKEQMGIAERDKGRRTAGQVFANAGMAGTLGLLAWLYPQQAAPLQLMIAAVFSSATADTVSSELGVVYGRQFYHVLSFKKDQKGLDGVISLEGTLLGLAGSSLIALVYALGFGWSTSVLWVVVAGTAGNFMDSFLGATLERSRHISNNGVNFFNTLFAAAVALLLFVCLG